MTEHDKIDTVARKAVGAELRRARDTLGWKRDELKARLPFSIHNHTLAGYENGSVQCTTSRFMLLCETMGVSAPDLLAWAMQRAQRDLPVTGMQVDLRAIVADNKVPELLPLRRWARMRLSEDIGSTGVARLEWVAVQEMAILFGVGLTEFVECLIRYTPHPVPQRR